MENNLNPLKWSTYCEEIYFSVTICLVRLNFELWVTQGLETNPKIMMAASRVNGSPLDRSTPQMMIKLSYNKTISSLLNYVKIANEVQLPTVKMQNRNIHKNKKPINVLCRLMPSRVVSCSNTLQSWSKSKWTARRARLGCPKRSNIRTFCPSTTFSSFVKTHLFRCQNNHVHRDIEKFLKCALKRPYTYMHIYI